jgi:hypothetical protein
MGTAGFSWVQNSLDNIPWTTVDASNNIHQNSFANSENAYIFSYGRTCIDRSFYAGASIKLLNQEFSNIPGASANGYGLEGGLLYHLDNRLSMGLTADSGAVMKWSNGHEDRGGLRNKLGIAYEALKRDTLSFCAAADIIQTQNRPLVGHIGGELMFTPLMNSNIIAVENIALRFGIDGLTLENKYNTQGIVNEDINWTMGAGLTFNCMNQRMGIDYSFGSYRLGARHRISLNLFFL